MIAVVNGKSIPEGAFFFDLLREYGSDTVQSQIDNILLTQEAKTESDAAAAKDPTAESLVATVDEARTRLADIYDASKLAVLDAAFTPDVINTSMIRELSATGVQWKEMQSIVSEQGITISEDDITKYFLDNLQQWTTPESVKVSVIKTATEKQADAARQRIVGGETFEAVCKAVSTDDSTKDTGGDWGYLTKDSIGPENKAFEDAAFSLAIGAVSQPIQVQFPDGVAWCLIKVTDKQEAYEPKISDKHDDIYATLLQDRVKPFMMDWRRHIWEAAKIKVTYPIYSDNPTPSFDEETSPTPSPSTQPGG